MHFASEIYLPSFSISGNFVYTKRQKNKEQPQAAIN